MSDRDTTKYVAFLRGINVGGKHKLPMVELKSLFFKMDFTDILTVLNTGNVIFESNKKEIHKLESLIQQNLESYFNFPIPVIIREAHTIIELVNSNPFEGMKKHDKIRLYATFLKKESEQELELPWFSNDNSFLIINNINNVVLSVLDFSVNSTLQGMNFLEDFYGKEVTTRNWNTILRISTKL